MTQSTKVLIASVRGTNRLRNRASRSVLFAALAAEVVYLVYRYSKVTRGAMVAHEIVDKLLALPAAVTRATEMTGYPV